MVFTGMSMGRCLVRQRSYTAYLAQGCLASDCCRLYRHDRGVSRGVSACMRTRARSLPVSNIIIL